MFKKIVGLGFSAKGKNAKDIEGYIKSLVDAGAGEFFVGYNPPYWHEKFGFEVSPNGRFSEHEQITDSDTLKAIVEEVHKHNLEIFINLNAWYYTDETFPLVEKMLAEFIEIGVDGIICGNIGILEYLKEIDYSGKINISTIMAVYNSEAIRFILENYKINKVILSRELTLKEIEKLTSDFPELKFEVFGEGDFCRYNNGLCFAEHKYGAKDICTIVVNDLVVKKKFRPDFKEFILDENLSNEEKVRLMDDSYNDDFEQIASLLGKLDLGFTDTENTKVELLKIVLKNKSRVNLYFDALKPLQDKRNTDILIYLRGVKYLLNTLAQPHPNPLLIGEGIEGKINELKKLEEELSNSFKTYLEYHKKKVKEIGGEAKLKASELASFYARGDNLNLYSYLFFDKIANIDTVKFPTRGRNYSEKIKLIENTLKAGKVDEKLIDRGASIERAHYDLTYLFGDKLWFREMIQKKS